MTNIWGKPLSSSSNKKSIVSFSKNRTHGNHPSHVSSSSYAVNPHFQTTQINNNPLPSAVPFVVVVVPNIIAVYCQIVPTSMWPISHGRQCSITHILGESGTRSRMYSQSTFSGGILRSMHLLTPIKDLNFRAITPYSQAMNKTNLPNPVSHNWLWSQLITMAVAAALGQSHVWTRREKKIIPQQTGKWSQPNWMLLFGRPKNSFRTKRLSDLDAKLKSFRDWNSIVSFYDFSPLKFWHRDMDTVNFVFE